MVCGVAVVEPDDDLSWKPVAGALDLRVDAFQRGEVYGLPRVEVDRVDVPVLIPGPVLEIQHVPGGVCPEVDADAPLAVFGDWTRGLRVVRRPHPDVEDAVHRGEEGQAGAIRADLRRGPVRVPEQHAAGDYRYGLATRRPIVLHPLVS